MSKHIYLAGGMSGLKTSDYLVWRDNIEDQLDDYPGWNVFNPPRHFHAAPNGNVATTFIEGLDDDGSHTEKEAMRWDLWALQHSDVVICNMNVPSMGTSAELGIAYSQGIPIIGFCDKRKQSALHPWWTEMANYIADDAEEAVLYFINHFAN